MLFLLQQIIFLVGVLWTGDKKIPMFVLGLGQVAMLNATAGLIFYSLI
jgi:hypothetical protein